MNESKSIDDDEQRFPHARRAKAGQRMNSYTMPQHSIDVVDLRLILHIEGWRVRNLTVNDEDWLDMGLPCQVTTPDGLSCGVRMDSETPSGEIWVYYHPEPRIPAGAIQRAMRGLKKRIRRWKTR